MKDLFFILHTASLLFVLPTDTVNLIFCAENKGEESMLSTK